MSTFEIVKDCIVALGSLATVGTFIKMILVGKKQDERITRLEDQQIDALYKPNLRVDKYGTNNYGCSVTLNNHGNSLIIKDIISLPVDWLKKEEIKTWFPRHLDEGENIVIPLIGKIDTFKEGEILISVEDRLGRLFNVNLSSVNDKFIVSKVEQVKQ